MIVWIAIFNGGYDGYSMPSVIFDTQEAAENWAARMPSPYPSDGDWEVIGLRVRDDDGDPGLPVCPVCHGPHEECAPPTGRESTLSELSEA